MNDSMELNALRGELAQEIFSIEDKELLKKALKSIKRLIAQKEKATENKEEECRPYTMEELNARIDEGEAEEEAGLTSPNEKVMGRMRKYIATL